MGTLAEVQLRSVSEYGLRDQECIWVSRFEVHSGGAFPQHTHPMGQILWVNAGQVVVEVGGHRWMISPSRAVWVPGDIWHAIEAYRDTDLFCVYLWDEECPPAFGRQLAFVVDGLCRELFLRLSRPNLQDTSARQARNLLLDVLEVASAQPIDLPMPDDPQARTVADAVLAAPHRAHRLSQWAARLYTSERTIQRAFLAGTGLSYSAWRTRARLLCSLTLLSEEVPVNVIAGRVGYSSVTGYTSAFRREFGTTPGLYRAS